METKTIQISAGRGPLECCWVVAQVLKFFLEEVKNNQIEYTILNKQNGLENGTVQSVTIQLCGNFLDDFLSQWMGTIQWIGKSQFRKYHKRKNWFVGVYELQHVRSQKIAMQNYTIKGDVLQESSCGRQNRALELLTKQKPESIADCFEILSDPDIKMNITMQQMVFNINQGTISLRI